jgi:hypothetical protein
MPPPQPTVSLELSNMCAASEVQDEQVRAAGA